MPKMPKVPKIVVSLRSIFLIIERYLLNVNLAISESILSCSLSFKHNKIDRIH